VADSCICVAAFLFVIRSFFEHPEKAAPRPAT
jgi:lipoprotein signal peptidase